MTSNSCTQNTFHWRVLCALSLLIFSSGAHAQTPSSNYENIFGPMIIGLLALLYFAPSIIAWRRNHENRWLILLLNIVLGWTGIGWLAVLSFAVLAIHITKEGKIVNNIRT